MELSQSMHTDSEKSWIQIYEWINQCSLDHNNCRIRTVLSTSNQWPARIIVVGSITNSKILISRTSSLECSGLTYVTLSHCWGSHSPTRLVTENVSKFADDGISLEDLPKTFRDAVLATRKLGVAYL